MYVAVKGGESAIRNSQQLLAEERRGDAVALRDLRRPPGKGLRQRVIVTSEGRRTERAS